MLDAAVACKHLLSCCNKQEQTRDDDDAGVPSQPLHLAAGIATMGVSYEQPSSASIVFCLRRWSTFARGGRCGMQAKRLLKVSYSPGA